MTFGFHREQWSELLPSHHPSLSESFITTLYIYERHTLIYIHPPSSTPFHDTVHRRVLERIARHAHHSETSCPTNRDLSLLLVLMEAML